MAKQISKKDRADKIKLLESIYRGELTLQSAFTTKAGCIWIETDIPGYFKNPDGEIKTRDEISAIPISRLSAQLIVL